MSEIRNPFAITTPEDLTASETVSLFVDVFSDFKQILDPGHVFLKGPRGAGKSMMFRYLQPDCQLYGKDKTVSDLDFVAVYIPLKNTNFRLMELKRFENRHASILINEHLMVTHCLIKVFDNLLSCDCYKNDEHIDSFKSFYRESFVSILGIESRDVNGITKTNDLLQMILKELNQVYRDTINSIKRSALMESLAPYTGLLFDYIDYLVPLLESLSSVISTKTPTFYLLLDDAHFLSEEQTKILNSWVSSRTSRKVSLKISTQYNYKHYYTTNGQTIDMPHDFTEIDIATVYTKGNNSNYYKRIKDITERRLKRVELNCSAEEFFPVDEAQEKEIEVIRQKYISDFDQGKGRGHNRTDDANRYARPDFIKGLSGVRKSSSTYSYAGFSQLLNISSGVVRCFLQQAFDMYAREQDQSNIVNKIDASIQNQIVRDDANHFLFDELEYLQKECTENVYPKEDIEKLKNLIQGLGGLFRQILLSDRSERRVFSVAISNTPSDEVLKILNLGIQLGYFHNRTIGRKENGSIGRTRLYVLNRRLAPIWNLDPNGFSGYLFVNNQVLVDAINQPFSMIKGNDLSDDTDFIQLSIWGDPASVEAIEEEI